MTQLTITEALAEIKTLEKRIQKKQQAILPYLARQEGVKDPMLKSGGSEAYIATEHQSVVDLQKNLVALRIGINRANDNTSIVIADISKTISEWLIWRRDISKNEQTFLNNLRLNITTIREKAIRSGATIVNKDSDAQQPADWIINVDEAALLAKIEKLETVLSTLDGQLSLKNATTMIEY